MKLRLPSKLVAAILATASTTVLTTLCTGSSAYAEGEAPAAVKNGETLGNVMYIGDSITNGHGGMVSWRWPFFKILTDNGITQTEQGINTGRNDSQKSGYGGSAYQTTLFTNETYGGQTFKNIHTGYSSGRAWEISGRMGGGRYGYTTIKNWLGVDKDIPNKNTNGGALTVNEVKIGENQYLVKNGTYVGPEYSAKNGNAIDNFFLLIGTNDLLSDAGYSEAQFNTKYNNLLGYNAATDTLTHAETADMEVIYNTMKAQAPSAGIVMLTIPTTGTNSSNVCSPETVSGIMKYNDLLTRWVADKNKAVDDAAAAGSEAPGPKINLIDVNKGIIDVTDSVPTTTNGYKGTIVKNAGVAAMFNDGLHPSAQGELIIAGNVAKGMGIGGRTAGLVRSAATAEGWSHAEQTEYALGGSTLTFAENAFTTADGYTVDFGAVFGDGSADGWLASANALSVTIGDGSHTGTLNMSEGYIMWGSNILYSQDNHANTDNIRIAYHNGVNSDNVASGYYVWLGDMLIGEGLTAATGSDLLNGITLSVSGSSEVGGTVSNLSWVNTAYAPTSLGTTTGAAYIATQDVTRDINVAAGATETIDAETIATSFSMGNNSTLNINKDVTIKNGASISTTSTMQIHLQNGAQLIASGADFGQDNTDNAKRFSYLLDATTGNGTVVFNGDTWVQLADAGADFKKGHIFKTDYQVNGALWLQQWGFTDWGAGGSYKAWSIGDATNKASLTVTDKLWVSNGQRLEVTNNGALTVGGNLEIGLLHQNTHYMGAVKLLGGETTLGGIKFVSNGTYNGGHSYFSMTGGTLRITGANAFADNSDTTPTVTISGGTLKAEGNSWTLNRAATIGGADSTVTVVTDAAHSVTLGARGTTTTMAGGVSVGTPGIALMSEDGGSTEGQNGNVVLDGTYAGTGTFDVLSGSSLAFGTDFDIAQGGSVTVSGHGAGSVLQVLKPGTPDPSTPAQGNGYGTDIITNYTLVSSGGTLTLENAENVTWKNADGVQITYRSYANGVLSSVVSNDPHTYYIVSANADGSQHVATYDDGGNAANAEHFELSHDGTVSIGSGRTLQQGAVTLLDGSRLTLQGRGTYALNSGALTLPTGVALGNAENWKGTVKVTNATINASSDLSALGNANSIVELTGVSGFDKHWASSAGAAWGNQTANIRLTDDDGTLAWVYSGGGTNGASKYYMDNTGKWSGGGTFKVNMATAPVYNGFRYSGDISEWTGTFEMAAGTADLWFHDRADTVKATIAKTGGTLNLYVGTSATDTADVTFHKAVTASTLNVYGTATMLGALDITNNTVGAINLHGADSVLDLTATSYNPAGNNADSQALVKILNRTSGEGVLKMKIAGGWLSSLGTSINLNTNLDLQGRFELSGSNNDNNNLNINSGYVLNFTGDRMHFENSSHLRVRGELNMHGDAFLLLGNANAGSWGNPGHLEILGGKVTTHYIQNAYATDASTITLTNGGALKITSDKMFAELSFNESDGHRSEGASGAVVTITDGKLIADGNDWTLNHNSTIGNLVVEGANTLTIGTAGTTTTISGAITNSGNLVLAGQVALTRPLDTTASTFSKGTYGYLNSIDIQVVNGDTAHASAAEGTTWSVLGKDAAAWGFSSTSFENGRLVMSDKTSSGFANGTWFMNTGEGGELRYTGTGEQAQMTAIVLNAKYNGQEGNTPILHLDANPTALTGNITVNNTTAKIEIGDSVTLNKANLVTYNGGNAVLTGSGTYALASGEKAFANGISLDNAGWTGTVVVSGANLWNGTHANLNDLGNTNSWVKLTGATSIDNNWQTNTAISTNLILENLGGNAAWNINEGSSGTTKTYTFEGDIKGAGVLRKEGTYRQNFVFKGDISGWTGRLDYAASPNINPQITLSGKATTVNAIIRRMYDGGNRLQLTLGDISNGAEGYTFNNSVIVDDILAAGKTVILGTNGSTHGNLMANAAFFGTLVMGNGTSATFGNGGTTITNGLTLEGSATISNGGVLTQGGALVLAGKTATSTTVENGFSDGNNGFATGTITTTYTVITNTSGGSLAGAFSSLMLNGEDVTETATYENGVLTTTQTAQNNVYYVNTALTYNNNNTATADMRNANAIFDVASGVTFSVKGEVINARKVMLEEGSTLKASDITYFDKAQFGNLTLNGDATLDLNSKRIAVQGVMNYGPAELHLNGHTLTVKNTGLGTTDYHFGLVGTITVDEGTIALTEKSRLQVAHNGISGYSVSAGNTLLTMTTDTELAIAGGNSITLRGMQTVGEDAAKLVRDEKGSYASSAITLILNAREGDNHVFRGTMSDQYLDITQSGAGSQTFALTADTARVRNLTANTGTLAFTHVGSGESTALTTGTITIGAAGTLNIGSGVVATLKGGSVAAGGTLTNEGTMVLDGTTGNVALLKAATGAGNAVITGNMTVGNNVQLGLTGNLTVTNGATLTLSTAKNSPTKLGWEENSTAKGFSSVTLAGGIITSDATLGIVRDLTVQAGTTNNKISFADYTDSGSYANHPTTFSGTTTLDSALEIFTEYKSKLVFDHLTGNGDLLLSTTNRNDNNTNVSISSIDGYTGTLKLAGATESGKTNQVIVNVAMNKDNTLEGLEMAHATLHLNNSSTSHTLTLNSLKVSGTRNTIDVEGNLLFHGQVDINNLSSVAAGADLALVQNEQVDHASVFNINGGETGAYNGTLHIKQSVAGGHNNGRHAILNIKDADVLSNAVISMEAVNNDSRVGLGIDADSVTVKGITTADAYGEKIIFSGAGTVDTTGKNSAVYNGDGNTRTLVINTGDNAETSYTANATVKGNLNLTKDGAGTQKFSGNVSDFNGTVAVNNGTLAFTGLSAKDATENINNLHLSTATVSGSGKLKAGSEAGSAVLEMNSATPAMLDGDTPAPTGTLTNATFTSDSLSGKLDGTNKGVMTNSVLDLTELTSYTIKDMNLVNSGIFSQVIDDHPTTEMTVSNVSLDATSYIIAKSGSTLSGENRLTLSAGDGITNGVIVSSDQLKGLTLTNASGSNLTLDLSAHGYAEGAKIGDKFTIELSDFSWQDLVGTVTAAEYGTDTNGHTLNDIFKVLALGSTDTYFNVISVAQGVRGGAGITLNVEVPEPTTSVLSLLALAGMAARRRRK